MFYFFERKKRQNERLKRRKKCNIFIMSSYKKTYSLPKQNTLKMLQIVHLHLNQKLCYFFALETVSVFVYVEELNAIGLCNYI